MPRSIDKTDTLFLKQLIKKAIRFIKVEQFHSGFPQIVSPEQGGIIEVSIKQDSEQSHIFHVHFKFLAMPDRRKLFAEHKIIDYKELKRLAKEYDKHKQQIDEELSKRHLTLKEHFHPKF